MQGRYSSRLPIFTLYPKEPRLHLLTRNQETDFFYTLAFTVLVNNFRHYLLSFAWHDIQKEFSNINVYRNTLFAYIKK